MYLPVVSLSVLCSILVVVSGGSIEDMLSDLNLTPDLVSQLLSRNSTAVRNVLAELLRNHLSKTGISLTVTPQEVRFSQDMANQCQSSHRCGCEAETRDINMWASIIGTPSFSAGHHKFQDQASIFLELGADAVMGVTGNVRGRLYTKHLGRRKKRSPGLGHKSWAVWNTKKTTQTNLSANVIYTGQEMRGQRRKRSPGWKKWRRRVSKAVRKVTRPVIRPVEKVVKAVVVKPLEKVLPCARLVRKTVGFDLATKGTVKMGVGLSINNLNVSDSPQGIRVSFDPSFSLVGQIINWELTKVEADKCTEKLLGVKLISYCGFLERRAKKEIEEKMAKLQELKLPGVIRKVEDKLQAKIGQTVSVVIPMDLGGGGGM